MSWFDTISRWKKPSTEQKESSEEILKKNTGKKVYRDIHKKREKILSIQPPRDLHKPKK